MELPDIRLLACVGSLCGRRLLLKHFPDAPGPDGDGNDRNQAVKHPHCVSDLIARLHDTMQTEAGTSDLAQALFSPLHHKKQKLDALALQKRVGDRVLLAIARQRFTQDVDLRWSVG